MVMCLLLVVLMATGLAAPVMAESGSGKGSRNGYAFAWTITRGQSTGVADIRTTGSPANLTSSVKNQLFYDLTGDWGESDLVTVTGYAIATATATNLMEIGNVPVEQRLIQQKESLRSTKVLLLAAILLANGNMFNSRNDLGIPLHHWLQGYA